MGTIKPSRWFTWPILDTQQAIMSASGSYMLVRTAQQLKYSFKLNIVGADDTGLGGRFSRGFLAHDMGFMYQFCYVF
jgi:hypothetical protein